MAQVARIKLVSSNIDAINKFIKEVRDISEKLGVNMKGPIALPTKKLKIKVRKSPDGEGKASWERYQMWIHKRLIEVTLNDRVLRMIMKIKFPKELHIQIKLI